MKSLGITRKVDKFGRVVVPAEIRETLNLDEGSNVDIKIIGRNIMVTRYSLGCIFCENTEDVKIYNKEPICFNCITKIKKGLL